MLMKIKENIENYQAVWWIVLTVFGIISSAVMGAVYLKDKDTLLTATAAQMSEVKTEAAAAKLTAERAAYEVENLQVSVGKSSDKLDTIVEQMGSTAGKLDILIQLTRSPFAGMKLKQKEPEPIGPPAPIYATTAPAPTPAPRVYTR